MLIYGGPAGARAEVLALSQALVQHVASHVTLVSGGGSEQLPMLQEAAAQLAAPADVPIELRSFPGDAQAAIMAATEEQMYDLVVFGRLDRPSARVLPNSRSTTITRSLQPSVLRVQGRVRPIRRILLAGGGDYHTFDDVSVAARLAGPLGAEVTIIHVVLQQSLVFEGFGERRISVGDYLAGSSPEASTLRNAAGLLRTRGIAAHVKGRSGRVLDELVDELQHGGYDLLVIGAHGIANPLDRILLDDITGELLDISPLPVLVVKGER